MRLKRRFTNNSQQGKIKVVKTHFKDLIQISQGASISTNPNITSLNEARNYITEKLINIKQKRMLGMKIKKEEIDSDRKLDESMCQLSRELLGVYRLRRDRCSTIRVLKKGQGRLVSQGNPNATCSGFPSTPSGT